MACSFHAAEKGDLTTLQNKVSDNDHMLQPRLKVYLSFWQCLLVYQCMALLGNVLAYAELFHYEQGSLKRGLIFDRKGLNKCR